MLSSTKYGRRPPRLIQNLGEDLEMKDRFAVWASETSPTFVVIHLCEAYVKPNVLLRFLARPGADHPEFPNCVD